jgi:hypothetical protein
MIFGSLNSLSNYLQKFFFHNNSFCCWAVYAKMNIVLFGEIIYHNCYTTNTGQVREREREREREGNERKGHENENPKKQKKSFNIFHLYNRQKYYIRRKI